MKNFKNLLGGITMFALGLCFTACSDDDAPQYSSSAINNSELKTILISRGFTFNEQGNLLLDDKANSTTTLDLSGTNLSQDALAGLGILPNLTDVNLSNNGYGPVFDFSKLPAQITGVDLRGNELYDFEGLVDVKMENDERQTKVLHNLKKLYLPESAKYNVEDLMPYYETAGGTTDMQMVNKDNTLEKYNTLREIPDEYFRAYLKSKFNSIFVDETHIDLRASMGLSAGESINLGLVNQFADVNKIKSIEGIEYFINNPYYHTFFVSININNDVNFTTSYLSPRENVKGLLLTNTNTTKGIDFSKSTKLVALSLSNNDGLTDADLSNTLISNQKTSDFDATLNNNLSIKYCKNLKSLKLPGHAEGVMNSCELIQLPSLEAVDLSQINAIETLALVVMPKCNITYPDLKYTYYSETNEKVELSEFDTILFAISEDVYNMGTTKSFFAAHPVGLSDEGYSYLNDGAYIWE